MNIPIERSEYVEIPGLTEAAVASPDTRLVAILNYLQIASNYFPDGMETDDVPGHSFQQLRAAVFGELNRRAGDNSMSINMHEKRLEITAALNS